MTETESITAPSSSKSKKTAAKPKKASDHPKFSVMIAAALNSLKERSGSSRQAILKYIQANYKVDVKTANNHLKLALKAGIKNGTLKQSKGNGASGSFKLSDDKKEKAKKDKTTKKSTKPKAPKNPKAAGTKSKKVTKKPKEAKPKKTPTKTVAKKPKTAKKVPTKPKSPKAAPKKTVSKRKASDK